MKLVLDNHFDGHIARELMKSGHDVVTAFQRRWHDIHDDDLLANAVEEQRVLMTNNVRDVAPIAKRWQGDGRSHFGLIFTDDRSAPRGKETIGHFITALTIVFDEHPDVDALVNRVVWLSLPGRG